ncbi:MAG: endopeptidase La [Bdellovibrionales bacterium RIFOXYD1_FULL_53_11]|nr:MAG: endopeptidase La [Bdellovibrionales bacterium RIFOXYD1_FULL_53_11]
MLPDQFLPPNLYILPVNSAVVFPTLMAPIMVNVPRFVATVEEAISRQRFIGLLMIREGEVVDTTPCGELWEVGVVVRILKRLKLPDGSVNLLVQSVKRFKRQRIISEQPYIVVETGYLDDVIEQSTELDALTRSVIANVKKLAEVNPYFTDEMRLAMINAPGPGTVADLVAFALALPKKSAQEFLETLDVKQRFEMLIQHLKREQNLADIQRKINDDVNTKITTMQREYFLKEQLKSIKRELGVEEDGKEKSSRTFRERIESAGMPEEAKKIALEELEKFETLSEHSPDFNVTRTYLETLCSLPWSKETRDNLDLANARKILDEDHYGLEKVKERIIEFIAVRTLKTDPKGSIICLVGPPGVGKTSVGKSIARALGRKFFRFSLGGMRDEAEIKGHRRTYVGALPGKVIQGIKRAGSRNAVLMLDEIDKVGKSFQGDPASALLEALDPEQNHAFLDHYIDVPFDLSRVLFITTANSTSTIPSPLLDRMELIELPGYTLEEKEEIAIDFVIPRELDAHGLRSQHLKIERGAIRRMMLDYAREPGLRVLQQLVARICRKTATSVVEKKNGTRMQVVLKEELEKWLGPKRYYNEIAERIAFPGVAVGLAWTSLGGDILFIEATDVPGANNLKLTGQMGDVMSESAAIAWSYVKRKCTAELGLDREYFKNRDFHLHVPSGAIPKDGPSAGITMAISLYSLLSGRKSRQKIAMTGELSLVGKVLPIGGVKEKILAARRAGIVDVILPKLNEKDLTEVPDYAIKGLRLHFVSSMEEIFDIALDPAPSIIKKRPRGKIIRKKMRIRSRPLFA